MDLQVYDGEGGEEEEGRREEGGERHNNLTRIILHTQKRGWQGAFHSFVVMTTHIDR